MSTQAPIVTDKMVFRGTNRHVGRHISVSPSNSATQHLAYGRIILNASKSAESFSTGNRETGLICLSGEATVAVDGRLVAVQQNDSVYISRDSFTGVTHPSRVEPAEFSAAVANQYPLQVVRL